MLGTLSLPLSLSGLPLCRLPLTGMAGFPCVRPGAHPFRESLLIVTQIPWSSGTPPAVRDNTLWECSLLSFIRVCGMQITNALLPVRIAANLGLLTWCLGVYSSVYYAMGSTEFSPFQVSFIQQLSPVGGTGSNVETHLDTVPGSSYINHFACYTYSFSSCYAATMCQVLF